jgi:hypothetical protein
MHSADFVPVHRKQVRAGGIILNLTHGLAVIQKIRGAELSRSYTAPNSISVRSPDLVFVTDVRPETWETRL